ncbi:flagellar hook-length control protein FliK [Chromatocurvus halotolerans]|nr:flagellar hook-length control protein FliK [Chromatocurvus halotolerans]
MSTGEMPSERLPGFDLSTAEELPGFDLATAEELPGVDLATAEAAASSGREGAPETLSAAILTLLAGLDPDLTALPHPLQQGEGGSAPTNDLRQWLLQQRLPASEAASMAEELADEAAGQSPTLIAGFDSRLAASETAGLAPVSTSAAGGAPPGLLDALQSLATAGQPPAGTDAQAGSALAGGMQASVPERQLDVAASRLPQPAPLPQQEFRATVSQTLEQVAWMSREGVHQARLQLEPAHLGRVDIWLDLEAGEARLHLGAQQAQVREALEAVLPRLRDALAEQGMTLTDASVSHSGRDDASGESGRGDRAGSSAGFAEDAVAADEAASPLHDLSASGLLDIYA